MSKTNEPRAEQIARRSRFAGRGLAVALMLPVLLLGPACDSGGGGGSNVALLCIDFDAPTATPASGTVSTRRSADAGCDVIEIEVVATNVSDVHAFQSVVTYDPEVAAFLSVSLDGSALESDGVDATAIYEEELFGSVTVGVTRIAADQGVDINGTQVLLKLAFARFSLEGRTGDFQLENGCLLDSGTPPTPQNVTCSGGTLVVR